MKRNGTSWHLSDAVCLIPIRRWLAMEITSDDIKANCEDLKVLGKGDFKVLIKWHKAIRQEVGQFHRSGVVILTDHVAGLRCQDNGNRGIY